MFEGIYFANPNYLWLLTVLPVALAWHLLTWKKSQATLKMPGLTGFEGKSNLLAQLLPFILITANCYGAHCPCHSPSSNYGCVYTN